MVHQSSIEYITIEFRLGDCKQRRAICNIDEKHLSERAFSHPKFFRIFECLATLPNRWELRSTHQISSDRSGICQSPSFKYRLCGCRESDSSVQATRKTSGCMGSAMASHGRLQVKPCELDHEVAIRDHRQGDSVIGLVFYSGATIQQ